MEESRSPQKHPSTAAAVTLGLDFTEIYQTNFWGSRESRSGHGSTMEQTAQIRATLPQLFHELGVKTLLDIPCGDFYWMQHIIAQSRNILYIGGDIVSDMIASNEKAFGSETKEGMVEFRLLDVLKDNLPRADLVLVRDCLVHLRLADALEAIQNIKRSGATYLLSTTFPEHVTNSDDFICGVWRTVNLERPPFNFPAPLRIINERCTESFLGESYPDKSLGLWALQDL